MDLVLRHRVEALSQDHLVVHHRVILPGEHGVGLVPYRVVSTRVVKVRGCVAQAAHAKARVQEEVL